MLNRVPRWAPIFAVALFALTLAFIPFYDFCLHLYSWHFIQPEFVQGGIELLAIGAALFVCGLAKGDKWKYVLLVIITQWYLRRHNADLAFLIAFLFAESLVGLGYIFFRKTSDYKIPTLFISGASLFVLISMALSLFDAAMMGYLLAFSSIMLTLFYVTAFRESLLYKLAGAVRHIYNSDHLTRLGSLLLYICLLMLAAKATYTINHDEAWYSLRLSEVLNSGGNFYEDLKLLGMWVHQYPKFFEVLLFPLQYFESFTVSKVFGVVVLGIGLIAAHEFWEGYHLNIRQKTLMSVVLISIPVVAGFATSAKADFFAGFVFLLSALYFLKGINERNSGFLLISAGTLVLTLAIKLSALAYVPVFLVLYAYATFSLRGELGRANRGHVAMAILFMASFCAVTWRTFEMTGVPFVAFADSSSTITSLFGLLGMEYKYPYGPISIFSGAAQINPLTLLFKTFVFPSEVTQSITWISNIAIPIVIMAAIWLLKFNRGKYESLLVVVSFLMIVGVIALVYNNKAVNGGDGNYYLMPMMVVVVVGATAFKWLSEHALSIALLCSIYVVANLPIAFASSQSWHSGTRGLDLVFDLSPFNKKEIQDQAVKANGLLDVRDYLASLDQRKCVALADSGSLALYYLGCRTERADLIFGTRPYLNTNEDSFVGTLKEKGVTHLVVQNYSPNSRFGRFSQQLIDSGGAKVSRFKFYNVIDITDITYDGLKRFAGLDLASVKAIDLDNFLPHTIHSASSGVEDTSGRVDFNPPRSGLRKYYSKADKVIFIKPDTAIEFLVNAKGQCLSDFKAYFAQHIHNSGQPLQGGKFTVSIFGEGKKLGEEIFSVNRGNQIHGKVQLHDKLDTLNISMKYESDGKRLNPMIPAVIVNPRIFYCNNEADEDLLWIKKQALPKNRLNFDTSRDKPIQFKDIDIKFRKWGPKSTKNGVVPNAQPNGLAGLWVQLEADPGLGQVQIYFDGKPVVTHFHNLAISASIPTELFNKPGAKKVVVRQVSTGRDFEVGEFVVLAD